MSGTDFDPYYKWLGIPPTDRPASLYRLLGLTDFESDGDVIDAAADQRMMLLRSHQNGRYAAQSQALLNEVSKARATLLDASRKATYDAQLQAHAQSQLQAAMQAAPVAQPVSAPPVPQKPRISINTNKGKRRGIPTIAIVTGVIVLLVFGGAGIGAMYMMDDGAEVASSDGDVPPASDGNVQPPPVTPPAVTPAADGSQPAGGSQDPVDPESDSGEPAVTPAADGSMPGDPVSTTNDPEVTDGGATPADGGEKPDPTDPPTVAPVDDPFASAGDPEKNDQARYAGPAIDLLASLDVSKHTIYGQTLQQNGALFTDDVNGITAVSLQAKPPAAYELRMDVERVSGDGALLLGLQMGGQEVGFAIDELPAAGPYTGFRSLNGNALGTALNLGLKERVIDLTGVATLTMEVRAGHIGLKHKDQQIFTWTGSNDNLKQGDNFTKTPGLLAIGSINCKLKISRLEMRPLKMGLGELAGQTDPEIDFGAGIVDDPFGNPGGMTNPGGFPGSLPTPGVLSRSKMPAAADVATARTRAESVFATEAKEARTPTQLNELAQTYRKTALAETEPANQYALLVLAREKALEAGNLQLAMQTIQDAADRIEIDAPLETSELLTKILSKPSAPQVRIAAVTAALETTPALMEGKNYDAAIELAKAGHTAASRLRATRQMAQFKKFRTTAEQMKRDYDLAVKAEEYLKTNPDNEKANLAWGQHLAFVEGDWEAAGPFLAKSGVALLVAAVDAGSKATDDTGKLSAGTAWKAAADSLKPPHQYAALRRSRYWFQQVVESGGGFDATEAKNHIAKIDKQLTDAGVEIGDAGSSSTGMMVGRVRVGRRDTGLLLHYRTGATLTQETLDEKLTVSSSTLGVTIELHGVLVLQQAGKVQFRHRGGSADRGILDLKIAGRSVSRVGDDRSKDTTETIPLAAGAHPVIWQIRGGKIGSCMIEFTRLPSVPGGAETPVSVVASPAMKGMARKQGVKAELTID